MFIRRNNSYEFVFLMSIETTICTVDISVPFAEWPKKFDIEEASIRDKYRVKVVSR